MAKIKRYPKQLKHLMAEKSRLLSKAEAFEEMGLGETARPLWAGAAACEERIAPLLDLLGRDLEAALHRISAAACYERCGDPSRAANLYRAALAGPLTDTVKRNVHKRLSACLKRLQPGTAPSVA
jgi:hypothetical protein